MIDKLTKKVIVYASFFCFSRSIIHSCGCFFVVAARMMKWVDLKEHSRQKRVVKIWRFFVVYIFYQKQPNLCTNQTRLSIKLRELSKSNNDNNNNKTAMHIRPKYQRSTRLVSNHFERNNKKKTHTNHTIL